MLSITTLFNESPDGTQEILTRTANLTGVHEFMDRWAPELYAVPGFAQFLTAFALAASGGDPNFRKQDKGRTRYIWKSFPEHVMDGPAAEVYCDYGLFALPLPWARMLLKIPTYTPEELLIPQNSFMVANMLISQMVKAHFQIKQVHATPTYLALMLHGSSMEKANNPYGVHYRGTFLPDFIAYFNAYPKPQTTEGTKS